VNRVAVLRRIDKLFKEWEKTKSIRERKKIEKEIQKLGEKLKLPKKERRIKEILSKNPDDLTVKDTLYLLSAGYSQKEVAKIMRVTWYEFNEYKNNLKKSGIETKGDIVDAIL